MFLSRILTRLRISNGGNIARRPQRWRRPAAAATALLCCAALCAGAQQAPDGEEPVATRREAELLARVASVAATNLNAAAAMLTAEDAAKSGAAVDFTLGNLYFRLEKFEPAVEAYTRALEKMPRFRRARLNLGRAYLLQDKPDQAVDTLLYLARFGQPDADGYILLGHALDLEQHPVSAENAYRQALLLDPGNSDGLLGLARSLVRQSRYREAAGLLEELLDLEPERRELWSLTASVRLALAEHDKAIASLESARRLGTADIDMLATLADLYLNAGQPDDAASAFRDIPPDGPLPADRLLRAGQAFIQAGEWQHAAEIIRRVESLRDSSPEALDPKQAAGLLRLKGDLARMRGQKETAAEIYSEILRIDPLDARTLLVLGDLHRESGALEEALMNYERASRIAGHEADALVRQAQIEVERSRYGRAVELLEAAQAFEDRPHVARYLEQVRRLVR